MRIPDIASRWTLGLRTRSGSSEREEPQEYNLVDVRTPKSTKKRKRKRRRYLTHRSNSKKTGHSLPVGETYERQRIEAGQQLTDKGFHYDNLLEMQVHCREETNSDRILSAIFLNRVLSDLAAELGDGIVLTNELRRLEAKYRTRLISRLKAS